MKRDFYLSYINSPDWRTKRNHKLRQVGYQCEQCHARRHLEVHHLTYERLGNESDSDLQVLCQDCHDGATVQQIAAQPGRSVYLKLASSLLKKHPFASISDLSGMVKDECGRLDIEYDYIAADKAIGVLSGSSRVKTPIPQTREEVVELRSFGRGLDHNESREVLKRLGLLDAVKAMPETGPFRDIDGPPPRENWGDHDEY